MAKSMALRICRGGKSCSKCNKEIDAGEKYWSGPYKSLCIECNAEEQNEETVHLPDSNENSIVNGNCKYCDLPAIGILWGKKVCMAHINQAITETV